MKMLIFARGRLVLTFDFYYYYCCKQSQLAEISATNQTPGELTIQNKNNLQSRTRIILLL